MNATMTKKADKKMDATVALAETKAIEFLGPDGSAPVIERTSGGFAIIYRDEDTGAAVVVRYKGRRTATKVSVGKSLKCYEAARLAAMLKVAADFAVNLDFSERE